MTAGVQRLRQLIRGTVVRRVAIEDLPKVRSSFFRLALCVERAEPGLHQGLRTRRAVARQPRERIGSLEVARIDGQSLLIGGRRFLGSPELLENPAPVVVCGSEAGVEPDGFVRRAQGRVQVPFARPTTLMFM